MIDYTDVVKTVGCELGNLLSEMYPTCEIIRFDEGTEVAEIEQEETKGWGIFKRAEKTTHRILMDLFEDDGMEVFDGDGELIADVQYSLYVGYDEVEHIIAWWFRIDELNWT